MPVTSNFQEGIGEHMNPQAKAVKSDAILD